MNHRGRRPRAWAAVSLLLLGAAACRDLEPVQQPARSLAQPHGLLSSGASAALSSSLSPSVQFSVYSPPNMAIAYGVNDAGLVVGEFGGNNIASVWSQATGTIVVGRTDGTTDCCSSFQGVNNLGQAVGFSHGSTYPVMATRWSLATGDQALVVFGRDYASGINDNGDIVGISPIGPDAAWFMTADGAYTILQFAAPATAADARSINNNRVIVGNSDIPGNSGGHALLWTSPTAVALDLGTLGGLRSMALYVNNSGDVVGWSEVANGDHHAFLWTSQTGMIDLGTFPNPCPGTSEAYAVNDLGIIAGECNNMPVIWTAVEGMRYLPMPAGNSGQARAINNHNTIVGAYNGRGSGAVWTIANLPPVANAGGPYTGLEGAAVAFDGAASSDPAGDAISYAWNFGDGTTGTGVAPTHTYADNGVYTVSLVVTDSHGGASPAATATTTIANVAPTLGPLSGPANPTPVNTAVSVSGSFTDPGSLDTHTGTVDWGDGTSSAANIGGSNTNGTVSGTHAYTAAGVYTVQVSVTDKDGGVSNASAFQYAVVYDASGGFVTGGGWINSPAGAYAANPAMTGKATFGFVSRYLPGAQVPSGNTEFNFQAAALRFSSTSYQWLVVSGARAQYKGSGTLNGQSGYGFILTAVDGDLLGGGQSDQFRIKITDPNGGVVYDNQMGASDTDPLAGSGTLLGGGSIQIHH